MIRKQFSQEHMEKIKAVMPDEMAVWRTVKLEHGKRRSLYWHDERCGYFFSDGLNESDRGPGFHCFVTMMAAESYLAEVLEDQRAIMGHIAYSPHVVSAKIHKQDIKGVGVEENGNLVVQVSQMIMPIYPATEVVDEAPDVPAEAVRLMEAVAH